MISTLPLWIMFALLIKHFVADYLFQSEKAIAGKGTYGNIHGIGHSWDHGCLTIVALSLVFFNETNLWFVLPLGLLDAVIHYHVDWFKQNITKKFELTPANKMFWTLLGADQLVHGLTYVLIAFLALHK